ncbi:HNH endonuclease [Halorussus pelagicus]|uniref:HNH endonuclease n=1 Tax=Halorussus pelagicus TaxID=2505977 RepID=UPI000FFC1F4B|nr:HNH endonuclease [Halorussus pelagicus]
MYSVRGATGKGIEIRYDDKGQKYLWLFAKEKGRYDDDIGTEEFRFTGEDPQGHGVGNPGEESQELNRGNKALRDAIDTPVPIFLFYRSIDADQWEYRGMVDVVSFEYKPRDGRYIYEFLLKPVEEQTETHSNFDVDDSEQPTDFRQSSRTQTTVSRIIRNTQIVKELKNRYEHTCQVCGDQRRGNDGEPYAEGHHIRPLGQPHNGKDEKSNILILCPNHHADFDYGRIKIDPETYQTHHKDESEVDGNKLTMEEGHEIESQYLRYQNQGLAQFD